MFLFWVGDVYTYSFRILFNVNVPFPSFGDAVYLTMYPVLMAGLLLLVRRRNPDARPRRAVDALIMTLGLALVSWIVLIAPYVHDNTLPLLPKLVSIAYPIGDIISAGRGDPAGRRQRQAPAGLLSADAGHRVDAGDRLRVRRGDARQRLTTTSCILDVGWIFFYLFWGAAALHPSMQSSRATATGPPAAADLLRLALLTGATLIAPALEIVKVVPARQLGPDFHDRRLGDSVRAGRRADGRPGPPARTVDRA